MLSGGAKDTVEEEALRRFDSSFRYLHRKALGHFLHLGRKSLDILTRIQYSCINKSIFLVFSWVLSALPVQLPMPGCLALTAAILTQKFPGSVRADMSRKSVPHNEETGELETRRPGSYKLYI